MVDIAINDVARRIQYSGNTGLGPFQFTFNVLSQNDIAVYKNSTALNLTADYTVTLNANGTGSITLTGTGNGTAVILADVITIVGDMALARVTDFAPGGDFQTAAVNEQLDSMIVMLQQLDEKIGRSVKGPVEDTITGFTLPTGRNGKVLAFDATTGAPTNGPTLTAVNNAEANAIAAAASAAAASTSQTAAAASQSSASTSASGASTSATNAASSASAASTSATNSASSATASAGSASAAASSASAASTSATNAANSATSAGTSASSATSSASTATTEATNAAASAAAAAASFDAFDDIYLGAYATNPTVDNDGNTLTVGDQYFNSVANELRVWNGTAWQAASVIGGTVSSLSVTGVASFADGSAAAPSIAHTGDLNAGLFFPAADTVAVSTAGSERMRVDSSGNVGVGTNSPADLLNVSSASGAAPSNSTNSNAVRIASTATNGVGVGPSILFEGQTGNSTAKYGFAAIQGFKGSATAADYSGAMAFYTQNSGGASALTERMRIDNAGNVGIGTTAPDALLTVNGAASFGDGSAASPSIANFGDLNTGLFFPAADTVAVSTAGTERMRIDASGGVGIGVTPSAWNANTNALDIGTRSAISQTATSTRIWNNAYENAGGTSVYKTTAAASLYLTDGGLHAWYNAPSGTAGNAVTFTQAMTLDASGRLGVGTTSPSQKLSVSGYSDLDGLRIGGTDVNNTIYQATGSLSLSTGSASGIVFKTNLTDRMAIDASGNITQANATSGAGAIVGEQTFRLAANGTAFGPTIGDFFGATSAISLEASSVYEITIYAVMTKTTAGTATWTLTASSAPTRIIGTYQGSPVTGIAAGAPISGFTGSQGATTAAFAATGSLTTAVNHAFQFDVQVQTNAATSFKLQLTQSAGTATPLAGSYYTVKKISATTGTFV